jgi:hypothetical protein
MLQHVFERGFIRAAYPKPKSHQGGAIARANMTCPLDPELLNRRPDQGFGSRVALARSSAGIAGFRCSAVSKTKPQSALNPPHKKAPAEAGAFNPPKFRRNQYLATTGPPQPQLNL